MADDVTHVSKEIPLEIPTNPTTTCWTESYTEQLITMLKANPCLYDVTTPGYKDRNKRKTTLENIASMLGTTGKNLEI